MRALYSWEMARASRAGGAGASLPAWAPAAGTFANISTNTLFDVRPGGWPTSEVAGPFANWSGGVYASSFSMLGAYSVYGSGHLADAAVLWAGVWCFDLDTLGWVGRNVPASPLLEDVDFSDFNVHLESELAPTLNFPYVSHTYDGMAYQSTANGGGAQGSMWRFGIPTAGAGATTGVHKFDLSSTSAAPTRVIDSINSSYGAVAADEARGGVWVLSGSGQGPLKFVTFSTAGVTNYAGVEYNAYGNQSLIYIPAPWDCLVGCGSDDGGGVNFGVYVCPIVAGVPQGFTRVFPSGTAPADTRAGAQWSMLLECLVSYEGAGSYAVHKLTPPPSGGSLLSGWAWSSETLTGVSGATPGDTPGGSNGAWGRMIEVPAARCLIWCASVTGPVQAWRLTGM